MERVEKQVLSMEMTNVEISVMDYSVKVNGKDLVEFIKDNIQPKKDYYSRTFVGNFLLIIEQPEKTETVKNTFINETAEEKATELFGKVCAELCSGESNE